MSTLLSSIAALNFVALALLVWRYRKLQARADALAGEIARLAPAAVLAAPVLDRVLGAAGADVIAVEILNPIELASKESRFAELFGSLTPALIRKLVYERTVKTMTEDLKKYGVEAQVSLHHGNR